MFPESVFYVIKKGNIYMETGLSVAELCKTHQGVAKRRQDIPDADSQIIETRTIQPIMKK